jgi:hypothetical protein
MIELAQNIEFLLLENDCVIVPGLGGFIAHYQPAHYEAAEQRYYPPVRTIGFNPQLILNDGLLAQLYMQKFHTDFPDATYRIQHAVEALKDVLFEEGRVEIPGVGELCFNMRHAYEFHPVKQGQTSPALYALQSFRIQPLGAKPRMEVLSTTTDAPRATAPRTHRPWISSRRWVSHIAAAAVAIVLFFALSTPVENTYVDNGNYASLGTNGLVDAIRSESLLANVVNPIFDQSDKKTANSKNSKKSDKKTSAKEDKKTSASAKNDKKSSDKKDSDKKASDKKDNSQKNEPKQDDKKQSGNDLQPVKVGEEKVPANQQQPANQQPANQQPTNAVTSTVSNIYHLIVSSLTTLADAQKELNNYIQKGYTNATIVEGNGRYRISLGDYTDMGTANNKLNELKKKDDSFKGAWLLRN